jgi:6-pyruvoyltetrahydropterin/6-carboxytetrahydropterin synthase
MKITKEYKMYYGHRNQELNDKCFRPHGHDAKIFITFNVTRNGNISTLFGDFDSKIEPMFKNEFDHRFIIDKNDPLLPYLKQFEEDNPGNRLGLKIIPYPTSVENVCYYIFNEIETRFGFDIDKINYHETRTSNIEYTKEDYLQDKINFK